MKKMLIVFFSLASLIVGVSSPRTARAWVLVPGVVADAVLVKVIGGGAIGMIAVPEIVSGVKKLFGIEVEEEDLPEHKMPLTAKIALGMIGVALLEDSTQAQLQLHELTLEAASTLQLSSEDVAAYNEGLAQAQQVFDMMMKEASIAQKQAHSRQAFDEATARIVETYRPLLSPVTLSILRKAAALR